MYQSMKFVSLITLAATSLALPQGSQSQGGIDGYGTFNKYSTQNSVNCEADYFKQKGVTLIASNADNKIFGAALSDVSNALGAYDCDYTPSDNAHNASKCIQSQQGVPYKLPTYDTYKAPFCPGAPCAKCYTITNKATSKKVTVQIIDACPSNTAWNYCKAIVPMGQTPVDASQRCADPGTAQVDMDESAYPFLTDGQSYASGSTPNLQISIAANPGCTAS